MADHQNLGFTFACVIQAPVDTVFNTIADQAAISTFLTDVSSGPLVAGSTVIWTFGDVEIDVHVEEAVPNQRIVANWPASQDVGYRTRFSFTFESHGESTTVHVSESGWRDDGPGIISAFDQCSGWTHFFASLKARLEHNLDLKHFFHDLQAQPWTSPTRAAVVTPASISRQVGAPRRWALRRGAPLGRRFKTS